MCLQTLNRAEQRQADEYDAKLLRRAAAMRLIDDLETAIDAVKEALDTGKSETLKLFLNASGRIVTGRADDVKDLLRIP